MDRLAEEVIQQIFTNLGLKDLRNVVLVNQRFARIATPLFFDVHSQASPGKVRKKVTCADLAKSCAG